MAGQTNLITSFVRRISKYFNSSTFTWPRPKRAIPGTNHIDNPSDFDKRTIYRGETIVDFDAGKLYSQDGGEIIEPNTQPAIIEGLQVVTPAVVGAVGGGTLWVSVESGAGRILGRNYYHEPASGLANGDIQLSPNPSPPPKARIDIIALKSDYPNPAPSSVVGTFGVDSTEYAAGLTAITGPTYNAGKAITFLGTYPGAGTTISIDPQQGIGTGAINVSDEIVGPGIGVSSTVTAITLTGSIITAIDVSVPPAAGYTNVTYAVSTSLGVNYAFQADLTAGSNILTNVYPQPALNELVFAPGVPPGTLTTNVSTPGQVTLSNSATLSTTGTIFQIGDVADHLIYDTTNPWPILDDDHLFLGLVFVPSNYTAGSPANILRPWSWSQIWQTYDMPNHTPKNLLQDYRSQITKYTTDTSYVSGQMIIDEQSHLWYQVIRNHYSSDLATSLSNGDMLTLIGIAGVAGATGPTGVGSPYQYNVGTPSAIEPVLGTNTASGYYSNIGGGAGNAASGQYSTIGGGKQNNTSTYNYTTVSGGYLNISCGDNTSIGGGLSNRTFSNNSTISGGNDNCITINGANSFIGGGSYNVVDNTISVIGGGTGNTATGCGSFIGGGIMNCTVGDYAVAAGGSGNSSCGIGAALLGGVNNVVGGNSSAILGGNSNTVSSRFSSIAGGCVNSIPNTGCASFIGGGMGNTASGVCASVVVGINNLASGNLSFIGGGANNTASAVGTVAVGGTGNTSSGACSAVVGGCNNTSVGGFSFVGGGLGNTANGSYSTVAGGQCNNAFNTYSFVGGGRCNGATGGISVVVGGVGNTASGNCSFIGGGRTNCASGTMASVVGGNTNTASGNYATVSGGRTNTASGACSIAAGGWTNTVAGTASAIVGGICNTAPGTGSFIGGGTNNGVSGNRSVISGGCTNSIIGDESFIGGGSRHTNSGYRSSIVGGFCNSISVSCINSSIGGGRDNTMSGSYSVISGGSSNTTSSDKSFIGSGSNNTTTVVYSVIGGGFGNTASGTGTFIGGGFQNTASGRCSAILGGFSNDICGFTGAMIVGVGLTAHADCTTFVNRLNIRDIPTSSVGLTAGDVWNSGGTLCIV